MIHVRWKGQAIGVNRRSIRSRHGTIITSAVYRAFVTELTVEMLRQGKGYRVVGPADVTVLQYSAHDIDALIKPILDALEDANVIENDKLVTELSVTKRHKRRRKELDRLEIWVRPDGADTRSAAASAGVLRAAEENG